VALGGSRVKTYFTGSKQHREAGENTSSDFLKSASDLDVGYGGGGNMKPASAQGINRKANELGPVPIEQFLIISGKPASKTFRKIESPEEFFQQTGPRPEADPKSATEPIATPSGSITFAPDGSIKENRPGTPKEELDIPDSGRKTSSDMH